MSKMQHGALLARRWGKILCAGVAIGLVAGCATGDNVGKKPPAHCKRSDARPANPNGSVLTRAETLGAAPQTPAPAAPTGTGAPSGVLMFGDETPKPAPTEGTDGASAVPSLLPPQSAVDRRHLTPASLGLRGAPPQFTYGSC